ncbi:MAG: hypothetical protein JW384_04057 [Nitrosomonadaceae bacterium]|nr:hypothetical protein [Nitrosomonadaceae bacterium]
MTGAQGTVGTSGATIDGTERTLLKLNFSGVGGNSNAVFGGDHYQMGQASGAWTYPYPDLIIGYHTGIRIGGYWNYGGTRFYNNSPTSNGGAEAEIFSVGNGDNHVRVANNLYVSTNGPTGGGIILADDGDIVDLNDAYCAMRFSYGVRIHSGNRTGGAVITLGSDGRVTANTDARAPIFYDNNDTGYYTDPASTSYQRSLFLGAHDSGTSEFRFGEDSSGWYGDRWYWDSGYNMYRYSRYAGTDSLIHYHDTRDGSRITYGRNIVFDNYGKGIVGLYDSTIYQLVFAMGDAYKTTAGGGISNLYGMAWSHPNAGGIAGNLDSHGMIVAINGGFGSCMAYSIKASSNVTAYSDERLKKDWSDLPKNYVEELAKVKVGTYTRIDGEKLRQVGVSAQSLKPLLPEAVIEATDDFRTLSVSYGNAAMASAVELAKEVVSLKEQMAILMDRLNKLENK